MLEIVSKYRYILTRKKRYIYTNNVPTCEYIYCILFIFSFYNTINVLSPLFKFTNVSQQYKLPSTYIIHLYLHIGR